MSSVTHDPLKAGRLLAMDKTLGNLPVGRRIELEKTGRPAELASDPFQRIDGQRRGHHRHSRLGRGLRDRHVAMSVLSADANDPDRSHEDRSRQLLAE